MTYELAKKLKDAGFEMDYNLDGFSDFDKRTAHINIELSELIEACGQDFGGLLPPDHSLPDSEFMVDEGWLALRRQRQNQYVTWHEEGTTPEEAVANLYLALNASKAKEEMV